MRTLQEWYLKKYPSDELGQELTDNITSVEAWIAMRCHQDIYEVLGIEDSIVRERIFEKMARDLHLKYDDIYDLWLHNDEIEDTNIDIFDRR